MSKSKSTNRGKISNEKIEKALKKKSEETGIPLGIIRAVMRRGMAAWKSGHRPGAGQEQWGYARVNSFLTKGRGTWGKADKDLAKEIKKEGKQYFTGLSSSTINKKKAQMKKQAEMSDSDPLAYKEMAGDTKGKKMLRLSKHTKNYHEKYGDKILKEEEDKDFNIFIKAIMTNNVYGNIIAIKKIKENKEIVNKQDSKGNTGLMYACDNNNKEMVEILLDNGADPNIQNKEDTSVLHIPILNNNKEMLLLLIKNSKEKVNINIKADLGITPLHLACFYGYIELVKELVKYGAKVNEESDLGAKALHIICKRNSNDNKGKNDLEIVKYLVDNNATLEQISKDGISISNDLNKLEEDIKEYLENKLKERSNKKEEEMESERYSTMSQKELGELIDKYLDSGEYEKIDKIRGYLKECRLKMNEDILGLDGIDEDGWTRLMYACNNNDKKLVEELLKKGADVNIGSDFYPIHISVLNNNIEILKILIKYDADIDIKSETGSTPLNMACSYGKLDIVRELLKNGADVNEKDKYGYSPLYNLCLNNIIMKPINNSFRGLIDHTNDVEIVEELIRYGADITETNKYGIKLVDMPELNPDIREIIMNKLEPRSNKEKYQELLKYHEKNLNEGTKYEKLIKAIHDKITRIKGKAYAPDVHEIQRKIDEYLKKIT
jgi:ankyrin repeat protein